MLSIHRVTTTMTGRRAALVRANNRPAYHRRPRAWKVEYLEERTLLSQFIVTNLNDAGGGSLRQAILDSNSDTTSGVNEIDFSAGLSGTITLTSGELIVSNGVSIVGPGQDSLSVSGNGYRRVFVIGSGVTASLSGMTISGGSAQFGGGIYNNGTLAIDASTLSGNSISIGIPGMPGEAIVSGGAIYNAGSLSIVNSTLSGNSIAGFDQFLRSIGGAIYSAGSLSIVNSTLSGNSVAGGFSEGGAIYIDGSLSIVNSTLSDNSADSRSMFGSAHGGAIYSDGALSIDNTSLRGNSANGSSRGIAGGGAIYSAVSLSIVNSTLSDNSATGSSRDSASGGAIYSDGALSIDNTSLRGNSATVNSIYGSAFGGAIFSARSLSIDNSVLSGNSANSSTGKGGAIYSDGSLSIVNSTLSGNSAKGAELDESAAGGAIYSGSTLLIENSTFSGNSVTTDGMTRSVSGGAIYSAGSLSIVNSTFGGNSATGGYYAGVSAPGNGGGIAVAGTGTLEMMSVNSIFQNLLGGNVFLDTGASFRSLGHNLFSDAPEFSLDPTDLINTDPLLGPLADNGGPTQTMALLSGSPAIDAGIAVPGVTTDQRGDRRPQGRGPDIGAFEFADPFDSLAAPTVTYGTASVTLSGHITVESLISTISVAITLNGVTQLARIDPSSGQFSSVFTTTGLHASASPFAITFRFAGDGVVPPAATTSTLTVTPAPLTIIGDNEAVVFGSALPALTATGHGFVNGDGLASLTRPVILSTTAEAYSPPGRYEIVASGAVSSDYTISYVSGTLTVTQPQARYERGCVAFLTTLYRNMLGRTAEPAGLHFWMGRMEAGSRVNHIARQIWTSHEHRSLVRHHAAPKMSALAAFNQAVRAWGKAAQSKEGR
jgi:predicted outer membrane repeat protein